MESYAAQHLTNLKSLFAEWFI